MVRTCGEPNEIDTIQIEIDKYPPGVERVTAPFLRCRGHLECSVPGTLRVLDAGGGGDVDVHGFVRERVFEALRLLPKRVEPPRVPAREEER